MLAAPPQFAAKSSYIHNQNGLLYPHISTPNQTDFPVLMKDLPTIFRQLRHLTQQILTSSTLSISDLGIRAFSVARSSIEHHLLSSGIPIKDKSQQDDYTYEVHRLAALIYLNLVLRDGSPVTAVIKALKTQLMATIQRVEAPTTHPLPPPQSAIWVLFMGGLCSLHSVEEVWFAERIARVMKAVDIESWGAVKKSLMQVAWVDSLRTEVCSELWQRVVEIRSRELENQLPLFSAQYYPGLKAQDGDIVGDERFKIDRRINRALDDEIYD